MLIMPQDNQPPAKKTGLAHILAATGYSIDGLRHLTSEAAFRHELAAAALVLAIYVALGVSGALVLLAICFMLLTFALEAVNTAIELVIDRTSPEISDYAKNAKDLGSFAVMCLLMANGLIAIYAIVSTLG